MSIVVMLSNQSENVWLEIWSKAVARTNSIPLWDELSELVHYLLRLLIVDVKDKLILEEGSGTGRISIRLAEQGSRAILLDISRNAIMCSKIIARKVGVDCDFIVGSIFHLPLRGCLLDVVWSSGVLEHYEFNKQQRAINEALRVLKRGGRLVVIVPNRKAIVYNISRLIDMKTGRWKLGYEEPLSLEEFHYFQPKPCAYYSAGFFHQLRFVTLPIIGFLLNITLNFVYRLWPYLKELDKRIPGYLSGGLWLKN
jgi:ubiquinone/menaquinone biosynthesis C-methylase UbiE